MLHGIYARENAVEPINHNRTLYVLLAAILGGGVLVSWHSVLSQTLTFLSYYDSLFHVRNCVVPNPLLTPCLYGAIALCIGFVWALSLALSNNPNGSRWLVRLLMFGSVFALCVLLFEALEYYHVFTLGAGVSCSPGTPPWQTACFSGFLVFLTGSLIGMLLVRRRVY